MRGNIAVWTLGPRRPASAQFAFFLPSPIGQKVRLCLELSNDGETPMKKFLTLYRADASGMAAMMKNSTPEQRKKGTESWEKWMVQNKSSLVDRGAPVGKTKRVDTKGVQDAKNDVCGYSIVQANSADEAAKIFGKDQPFLQMPGAAIEVIEIMEM
jgi:hypothetical protein